MATAIQRGGYYEDAAGNAFNANGDPIEKRKLKIESKDEKKDEKKPGA